MTPLLLRHLPTSLRHLSSPPSLRGLARTIMTKYVSSYTDTPDTPIPPTRTKLDTTEFKSLLTPELLTLSELFIK